MQIDAATRKSLELTHAMGGGRAGSLLAVIDKTVTAGGARLLERRLASPSCTLTTILARQDAVRYFVENDRIAEDLRDFLTGVHDLDRAALARHQTLSRRLASELLGRGAKDG